eukprot:12752167-Ditylum_brightwellii.AAC.1
MAPLLDHLPKVALDWKARIQQILGTLLFYGCAIDPTMLLAINAIACQQEQHTKKTEITIVKLLNYCTMHSDTKTRYHASSMVLHIHSDASYLSALQTKSRPGGIFSSAPNLPTQSSQKTP